MWINPDLHGTMKFRCLATKKGGKDASSEPDFNELLLDALDRAFLCLGSSSRNEVYLGLEKNFSLRRKEIPDRVGEFSDALEKIFGLGSRLIEILVMKELNSALGEKTRKNLSLRDSDLTFAKYIKLRKQMFENFDDNRQFLTPIEAGLKPDPIPNSRTAHKRS